MLARALRVPGNTGPDGFMDGEEHRRPMGRRDSATADDATVTRSFGAEAEGCVQRLDELRRFLAATRRGTVRASRPGALAVLLSTRARHRLGLPAGLLFVYRIVLRGPDGTVVDRRLLSCLVHGAPCGRPGDRGDSLAPAIEAAGLAADRVAGHHADTRRAGVEAWLAGANREVARRRCLVTRALEAQIAPEQLALFPAADVEPVGQAGAVDHTTALSSDQVVMATVVERELVFSLE
jgi:hypothetical protein